MTASQKVADSIAYLGAFAPEPGSFDQWAFSEICARGLSTDEQVRLWIIDRRLGILKDEPPSKIDGSERVSVSAFLVKTAKEQFCDLD